MRVIDGVETKDFYCGTTCESHGGKRKTCNGGIMMFDQIDTDF